MHARALILSALVLQLLPARTVVAQPSSRVDMSGTWVINLARSNFGALSPPTFDTTKVTRDGSMYQIDVITDFGGQGVQHLSYKWPVNDGDVVNAMSNGVTMHSAIKHTGDTSTFSSEVSVQGRAVARQTGREYLSPDGTSLTRVLQIQTLADPSTAPIAIVLVYNKRESGGL